jgi:hypothetical protein
MSFGDVDDVTIDSQMWTAYFHLGVAYLNQPALQVFIEIYFV